MSTRRFPTIPILFYAKWASKPIRLFFSLPQKIWARIILSLTNEKLLLAAKEMGMILVDVHQGYTKCSTVIVDETSIITYDEGIIKACSKYPDISVLRVAPGFVRLDGYRGFHRKAQPYLQMVPAVQADRHRINFVMRVKDK